MKMISAFLTMVCCAVTFATFSSTAQGQQGTSTVTSTSASGAAAILNQYNVIPGAGGGGGGVGGGLGGAVWVMGQTTGGNSVTSYDACLKNAGFTALFVSFNVPLEIAHCWSLRSMDAMAKYPPGSVQYEYGCLDSNWAKVDWDTGTMACTSNRAKLARNNPNDPRSQKMQYVPVVAAGTTAQQAPQQVPQQAPNLAPTAVPAANCRLVPGTTALTCG